MLRIKQFCLSIFINAGTSVSSGLFGIPYAVSLYQPWGRARKYVVEKKIMIMVLILKM